MAITVDWGQKIIHVPQSFLSHLGGTNYTLDTLAFKIAIRALEDNEAGVTQPFILNHNTTVNLGGIEYARILEITNGYTITFEDVGSPYAVSLIGSNNNILDVTNLNNVAVRSNNSAGLVQMQEIQYGVFGGGVWVDQANGVTGTTYPAGTPIRPVNNVQDAVTIAVSRGFNTIHIKGDLTLGTGDEIIGIQLIGESSSRTLLTINPAATVYNCEVRGCALTGTLDGNVVVQDCYVFDLSYVQGFMFDCELAGGIVLGGNATAHILNCFADVNSLVIDMGGSGQTLNMHNFSGGLAIRNKAGPENCDIHMNAGTVEVQSTVSNGPIEIRGIGHILDNSTGTAVVDTRHMLDTEETIPKGIMAHPIEGTVTVEEALRVILAALSGKTEGIGTATEKYKSINGLVDRITATFDQNGNRTNIIMDGS